MPIELVNQVLFSLFWCPLLVGPLTGFESRIVGYRYRLIGPETADDATLVAGARSR